MLLWQGQLISSVGKQAFALTCMLAIKDLTGSGSIMGLLMSAAILPSVVLGPVAGVFVDRLDRRRLIAYTDIAGGLFVLIAFAALFFLDAYPSIVIAALFAVTVATGLLDTFSQPAIGASIPDLVPESRLEAANGMNMGGVQIAVFVAQGAAGLLYRILGTAVMTLVNAVTYLYAGIVELFIRMPVRPAGRGAADTEDTGDTGDTGAATARAHPWKRFLAELGEGLRFVVARDGMLATLLSFACINFFAAPVLVTLPFYTTEYLGLGSQWYGYMMAAFGVGAMTGYVLVASIPTRGKARAASLLGCLALEAVLIAAALSPMPAWLAVGVLFAVGVANGVVNVNVATLFQLATPRELLGRVNALSNTVSGAAMPLGMALAGIAFDLSGQNVPLMFGASSVAMLASIVAPMIASRGFLRFLSTDAARGAA